MEGNILDRFKEVNDETVIDTARKIRVGIIGSVIEVMQKCWMMHHCSWMR